MFNTLLILASLTKLGMSSTNENSNLRTECNDRSGFTTYRTYIPFHNSTEKQWYEVTTAFGIWYPNTIRSKLRAMGYTVPDSLEGSGAPYCSWYSLSSVFSKGTRTGGLKAAVYNGNGVPEFDQRVITDVQEVLETNFPTADLTLFLVLGLSLAVLTGVVTGLVLFVPSTNGCHMILVWVVLTVLWCMFIAFVAGG